MSDAQRRSAASALLFGEPEGELLAEMDLEIVTVDHAAAVEVALSTGLTAYDAAYLWLSRALGAELVTLDQRLAAAAKAS